MRITAWHLALGVSAASHAVAFGMLPQHPGVSRPGQQAVQPLRFTVSQSAAVAREAQSRRFVEAQSAPGIRTRQLLAQDADSALLPMQLPDHDPLTRSATPHQYPSLQHASAAIPALHRIEPQAPAISAGAADSVPARPAAGANHPPAYPRSARRNGWEGSVLLSAHVGTDGAVRDVRILESSGHDVLDEAARSAIERWRFEPARAGAITFASTVRVPVVFTLRDE